MTQTLPAMMGMTAGFLALLVLADFFNRITVMPLRRWLLLLAVGVGASAIPALLTRETSLVPFAVITMITIALLELRDGSTDAIEGATRGGAIATGAIAGHILFESASVSLSLLIVIALTGFFIGSLGSIAFAQVKWLRLLLLALAPAVAVTAGSFLPAFLDTGTAGFRTGVISLLPLSLFAAVIVRSLSIRRELLIERKVGLFEEPDPRALAHPFGRFRFRVWADPQARKKYVQLATELALRKRRQRRMSQTRARLHQLEILKLRMDLLELLSITRMVERDLQRNVQEEFENDLPAKTLS